MPKFTFRERELLRHALAIACEDGSIYPTGDDYDDDDRLMSEVNVEINTIRRKLDEDKQLERTLRDLLLAFDDGVRSCVGIESSGNMVWKGSFIAYMERLRSMLPPERD